MREKWVAFEEVIGCDEIPIRAAIIIRNAMDHAVRNGDVSNNCRWQLLEFLCADYLAGVEYE